MSLTKVERKAIEQVRENLKSMDSYSLMYAPMSDVIKKQDIPEAIKSGILQAIQSNTNNLLKPARESDAWLEALLEEVKK